MNDVHFTRVKDGYDVYANGFASRFFESKRAIVKVGKIIWSDRYDKYFYCPRVLLVAGYEPFDLAQIADFLSELQDECNN